MKFSYLASIGLTILAGAQSQGKHTNLSSRPNDQLMLVEQFVRWYFPQLAGRNANIVFAAEVPVWRATPETKPETTQVHFKVDDWCDVPLDPQRGSLGHSFPCSQTDKNYESPLAGQMVFASRSGRIVVTSILLGGTLVDAAENRPSPTCLEPEPTHREQIVRGLQLSRLGNLLGGSLKVGQIAHEDGQEWLIVLSMQSTHRRYQVVLDKCGVFYNLGVL